jgi:hypothetical protein
MIPRLLTAWGINMVCLSYLSPAPQALPQAAGFSSGLSAAPHAAGVSAGLSPAVASLRLCELDVPWTSAEQAAGFSDAPHAAGLSDAPQALPAVFSFHPAMFDNAMIFTSVKLISVGPIAFLLS